MASDEAPKSRFKNDTYNLLLGVDNNETLISFYIQLADELVGEMTAYQIFEIFSYQIWRFCEGKHQSVWATIQLSVLGWIDAVVENNEVATSAKDYYRAWLQP